MSKALLEGIKISLLESFLLKPFLTLSEKSLKIRRNLNIAVLISLALTILGGKIDPLSFSGVKIQGIADTKLYFVFLSIIAYHLVYFVWCCIDEYWKWRLQLIQEKTDDYYERQTSEYTLSPSQTAVDSFLSLDSNSLESVKIELRKVVYDAAKQHNLDDKLLSSSFDHAWTTKIGPKITQDLVRLEVYERSFKNYHWQEFIRFVLLEFGFPVCLAIWALYEVCIKLITLPISSTIIRTVTLY